MKKLYIIDASGYAYRAYFAIRNMTNDQGQSTNALFGFIRSVLKLFKDFRPDHCISVFDGHNNKQSRSSLYPEYKGHRAASPPDLIYQMEWAREFCRLYGIPMISIDGVEADDTIASIALWAAQQGTEVYICSSDKDLYQLVGPHISILDTYKENLILGPKEAEEKFGVPPHHIIDYLALIGDSSDNVPGVPGIGPKSAVDLLKQFESLENLLNNIDKISGKKKQELIQAHQQDALLSQKLVTLAHDVEFPHEEAFFALKPIQMDEIKAFYGSKKFNTLIKELPDVRQELLAPAAKETTDKCHVIETQEALKDLILTLKQHPSICLDVLTTHNIPFLANMVGIGFGFRPEETWYVPLNGPLDKNVALEGLRELFSDPTLSFYGHDIKYDYHILKNAGIELQKVDFDTILASYLLQTHSRRHSLEDLSIELFNFVNTSPKELLGKGKQQITMDEVPLGKAAALCCENIGTTIRLKDRFVVELEKRGLSHLFFDLELPLLKVLARMEQAGIFIDVAQLARFGTWLAGEIQQISQEIYTMAGEEFNLNSPLQISKILFEKMEIRSPKGASTSADVLEILKWEHPIAGKIQEYRVLEKLRSTYVDVLPSQVDENTQRIHCTFNQSGTTTGRLSCQDPNLQNIPIRTEYGLRIREAFRPQKEGWSYITADYSQIELRLLAHLSEDPVLLDAFKSGEDIHTHTASTVFHVPMTEVTKEMRSRAKAVNFGIIYGQGAYGLSQGLGISQKDAAQFIQMYFQQYPKVKQFLEGCKDRARVTGKAITITGRERILPEILSPNIQIRNAAERLAVNTPFQGSAADLIKKAMLDIELALEKIPHQGFMVLQVHDELIFEVPDNEIPLFKSLIQEKMEKVVELKVPLAVDVEVGKNWKEC